MPVYEHDGTLQTYANPRPQYLIIPRGLLTQLLENTHELHRRQRDYETAVTSSGTGPYNTATLDHMISQTIDVLYPTR